MKQIKSLLIVAIALLAVQTTNAQAKIAHVNVSEITTKMPAVLDAQKQLEKLSATYDTDYKGMVTEYQTKVDKYDKEASTVTDAINQTRKTEVDDMVKRINDFRENAQKELQKKEADMMKPLYEKVKTSIEKVGKAKGFQYVLNSEQLLLSDGIDLTTDVKKDLGF